MPERFILEELVSAEPKEGDKEHTINLCGEETKFVVHRILIERSGAIVPLDHTPSEVKRQLLLARFGSTDVCLCINKAIRLRTAARSQRFDAWYNHAVPDQHRYRHPREELPARADRLRRQLERRYKRELTPVQAAISHRKYSDWDSLFHKEMAERGHQLNISKENGNWYCYWVRPFGYPGVKIRLELGCREETRGSHHTRKRQERYVQVHFNDGAVSAAWTPIHVPVPCENLAPYIRFAVDMTEILVLCQLDEHHTKRVGFFDMYRSRWRYKLHNQRMILGKGLQHKLGRDAHPLLKRDFPDILCKEWEEAIYGKMVGNIRRRPYKGGR